LFDIALCKPLTHGGIKNAATTVQQKDNVAITYTHTNNRRVTWLATNISVAYRHHITLLGMRISHDDVREIFFI